MKIYLIFILLIINCNIFAQDSKTKVSGIVTGEEDKPIVGANLVIEGTIDGATTDEKGNFEFETKKTGQHNLIITAIDYTESIINIEIEEGVEQYLNIKLKKGEVMTEEILVTASSFTSGTNSQVTLTPLEIVRIPGADADLYRAITTFPGSNQVDEGSRITVRGGDPNEVLTIIDQASLYNPFIFDDTFNSSSYSTINPWGLRGINFSSGGFSAKFGNVLSSVLDLKSYNMPQGTGMFAWVGLANAGLSGVYLSKEGNFGATFSGGKLFLEPYFFINGENSEYSPIPQSNVFGGTLSHTLGEKGFIKFYGNYSDDKTGIKSVIPSHDGFFNSKSKSYFTNLKISVSPTPTTLVDAGISFSLYNRDQNYGILNTKSEDIYSKFRIDFKKQFSDKIVINTGAEYEYNGIDFYGTVPENPYNLRLNAPSLFFDTNNKSGRIGAYVESEVRVTDNFFFIPGIRSDYHTLSENISFDPRISLGYKISDYNVLRGAFGFYHQYPDVEDYSRSNEYSLKPERALHYILGYEFNKDSDFIFRIESYYKDYENLVLLDTNDFFYKSLGNGVAKGVDVFLKTKIENKFTGWISYAYTDSKRKQYSANSETSADYDITHNLSVVGSYNILENLTAGVIYKMSTGKPYTPVVGSYYDPIQDLYVPIYAEINSDRFPTYHRIDMNLQHYFSLFGRFAIVAVSVNNIFNQKNLYDYTYNFDYSLQKEIISTNRRSFYVGFGLQL